MLLAGELEKYFNDVTNDQWIFQSPTRNGRGREAGSNVTRNRVAESATHKQKESNDEKESKITPRLERPRH